MFTVTSIVIEDCFEEIISDEFKYIYTLSK